MSNKNLLNTIVMIALLLQLNVTVAQQFEHPRIYTTDSSKATFLKTLERVSWKNDLVEKKKNDLEKYLNRCADDPEWLVSRLQMNWKTKHNEVYQRGGDFAYSAGSAPVPTVRYSGTRDWATNYERPAIEDIIPYLDDEKGLYLKHKETGKMEWVHPSASGFVIDDTNEEIMQLVEDAAFLYWLTGDKRYAEFATPVFFTYIDGMHHRNAPIDLDSTNQQNISGLATFEVIHEAIVASLTSSYDFLYDYFRANSYDLKNTAAVFQKWGDQIIKYGIPDNNWNLFQARYLTYLALALEHNGHYENGKGQEYYLDHTFKISTDRQLSIQESLLVFDHENGMWPESASYSTHVITTLLRILTLLDQTTNANELANYPIIEKAALASFQYLFPNGYTVGFGDSNHKILPPENFELLLSAYNKYGEKDKEELFSNLLQKQISDKLYTRKAKNLFQLFFYSDDLNTRPSAKDVNYMEQLVSPTFYASNVSMFNQRMGQGDDAIMVSTVGSFGNHAHANGISLELFANNYVLGPDLGKGPSYWHPTHREFYARFPAHNTVVVDGRSDYYSMRTYFPFKMDNCYPKSGERTIFDKLTYSKVSFFEPTTSANQQRFTSIIKTPNSKSYVVDIFRSKKQAEGYQKHEYIYHNLGQSLSFVDDRGSHLSLTPTDELSSKHGDLKGYDYFKNKKKTVSSEAFQALFKINVKNKPDNILKVWVKGSTDQTIYSVKSPKSNALSSGTAPTELINEPLPTMILKRDNAAWIDPFAVVFNPYIEGEENPIEKVSYWSIDKHPHVQILDVLLSDKTTNDRIVLNTSENDITKKESFYQQGLLSITRKSQHDANFSFLFLSGMTKYEDEGWDIISSGEAFSVSIEKMNGGFDVYTDKPITINMPYAKEKNPAEIRLFDKDKLVATRTGTRNRNNPDKMVFKIEKAYDKIEIHF